MTFTTLLLIAFCFLFISNIVYCQDIQYNLSASAVLDNNFNVSLSILPTQGSLYINISGPSTIWFGVGFGNTIMTNTYAIVCSKDSTSKSICQENKLATGSYGQELTATINVLHDNTDSTTQIRRVYILRNISIHNNDYFSFPTSTDTINIIHGVGNSDSFTSDTTSMGPGGSSRLTIVNKLDNNVTVNTTALGGKIVLNSIVIYPDQDIMQLNMSGPSDAYFGIGFNSTTMGPNTYVIVCDVLACHENQLTGHSYGNELDSTTKVVFNNTVNGIKTIVVNRKRNITATDTNEFAKYFEFPMVTSTIPVIYAIGSSDTWSATNAMSFDSSTFGTTNIEFKKKIAAWSVVAKSPLHPHQSIDIQILPLHDTVNITLTGPDDKWFGVGFNSTLMADTYSIVCSDEPLCFEQLLGAHNIGQRFPLQAINTISDTNNNGIRKVTLTRKQIITQSDNVNYQYFYDFPSSPVKIAIIYAYGSNNIFITNQSSMSGKNIAALQFNNASNRHNLTTSLEIFASVSQTVQINVLPDENNVEIMFTGPVNVWYAIGFDSQRMNNTYAIVMDSTNNAHEYILGEGHPGNRLQHSNIDVQSNIVVHGARQTKITRPISILDPMAYDFPVIPNQISIISAYGTNYPYNTSHMHNHTIRNLVFQSYTPSNTSNGSMCASGIDYYGTSGNIGNGFSVGLYIYCKSETIQLSVDYSNYAPHWFGIVFNSVMTPSPNATVFTTGKPSETQRDIALYSYDLGAQSASNVIYHKERNWRKLEQKITGNRVSILYEQDLRNTKWDLYTSIITFRYAYGTSSQGTQLQQHSATSYSKIWKFNLATGSVSSSGSNTIQIAHGIIMILSWSLLTSIGVFSSRFRLVLYEKANSRAQWFFVHRGVQCSVVVLVLIGFGIAIYFTQDNGNQHFSNTHECVGLSVVILAVLQPINAWFRPHPPKKNQNKSMARLTWEIIHKSFGYSTWILAHIAIYLGIAQLTDTQIYKTAFIIWVSCVFAAFVLLLIYNSFCFMPQTEKKQGLLTNENVMDSDKNLARNLSPGQRSIGPADYDTDSSDN